MLRPVFFVLLAACSYSAIAQTAGNTKLDSLKRQIAALPADAQKLSVLINIAKEYKASNPGEAISWGKRAVVLARSLKNDTGELSAENALGKAYHKAGNDAAALEAHFVALTIAEGLSDKKRIAETYGNIGIAYNSRGEFETGLQYHQKALKLFLELVNAKGVNSRAALGNVAMTETDIGNTCKDLRRYPDGLSNYREAERIFRSLGMQDGIARCLEGIGNIYLNQNELVPAIRIQKEALALYDSMGNQHGMAIIRGNLGVSYLSIAQDSLPRRFATPGLVPGSKAEVLRIAIDYFNKAYAACTQMGDFTTQEYFSEQLAIAYEEAGDAKSALKYYKAFKHADDSMRSIGSAMRVAQIETERAQMLQDKQIELAAAKKRNERVIYIAGLLLLIVIVFFSARERKKSERLLLNILPGKIARRLKRGENPIADQFASATVIFIDMAGFTQFSEGRDPRNIVATLNDIFTRMDALAEQYGLEKIKTIGDAYMAVAGLPEPVEDHAARATRMALAVQREMAGYTSADGTPISFRIGLDCGPVVAGVIGRRKFIYDLWGDAVNTASRMESSGVAGQVHCSDGFRQCVDNGQFQFVLRGEVEVKGKGLMRTWFIEE